MLSYSFLLFPFKLCVSIIIYVIHLLFLNVFCPFSILVHRAVICSVILVLFYFSSFLRLLFSTLLFIVTYDIHLLFLNIIYPFSIVHRAVICGVILVLSYFLFYFLPFSTFLVHYNSGQPNTLSKCNLLFIVHLCPSCVS